jgi:sugar lactone lactonase YvrE
MRKSLRVVLIACAVLGAVAGYLLLAPVPVQPIAWDAPKDEGYTGAHAPNTALAKLQTLPLAGDSGPEHVLVRDGWIYSAVASGAIIRMREDGSQREVVVKTGGRPLGFDFDAAGALIVADAEYGAHGGLLRVTLPTGPDGARIEVLADAAPSTDGETRPLNNVDAVVVAADGMIYFTDASERFGAKAYGGIFEASILDILEHSCTGRLLAYDPRLRTTRLILGDLCFANGLALSAEGHYLFVAETGAYRIWKVATSAINQTTARTSDDSWLLRINLPGFPDNLMRGRDGRIWVGLAKPRSAFLDAAAGLPWLRAMSLRLPRWLWPVPRPYGHVIAMLEDGRIVADLQDPSGEYPETTGVTETETRLYIQSLHASALGWLNTPAEVKTAKPKNP